MDPSLSISNDPHHPPQFSPFPFSSSNSVPPTNYYYGHNPFANLVFQPQPQPQPQHQPQPQPQPQQAHAPPQTHYSHTPYTDMICKAIASLNEPDGSSKLAISKFINRTYTNLPPNPSHGALLTHHLKSLKSNGVLTMVKKSYKFAGEPESVAVAAAATAAGLEPPRSEVPLIEQLANIVGSASQSQSQSQKRGRGRPPKPKPEPQPQQQETAIVPVQPNPVQSNGPVTEGEGTVSAKRRPGRPRKDAAVAGPIVQVPVTGGIVKRRGRPPGRRAAGRERKPISVSTTVSVIPYVANGVRRRGRPRRVVENSGAIVPVVAAAPAGGEIVPVGAGVKRGRGRPPKAAGVGVITRVIAKPKRGRGRAVGRPRKYPIVPVTGAQDSAAYGELKTKFDLFQEKAKEILNVLKAGVKTDDEAVVRAMQDLEGLTVVEPQAMEGVNPEEAAAAAPPTPPTEAETQGGTQGGEQGFERGGGEQVGQSQTEAEAMQQALF